MNTPTTQEQIAAGGAAVALCDLLQRSTGTDTSAMSCSELSGFAEESIHDGLVDAREVFSICDGALKAAGYTERKTVAIEQPDITSEEVKAIDKSVEASLAEIRRHNEFDCSHLLDL